MSPASAIFLLGQSMIQALSLLACLVPTAQPRTVELKVDLLAMKDTVRSADLKPSSGSIKDLLLLCRIYI